MHTSKLKKGMGKVGEIFPENIHVIKENGTRKKTEKLTIKSVSSPHHLLTFSEKAT